MEQSENKINFFDEKKWIMALWYKRNRKCHLNTAKQMLEQWHKWWKDDFINEEDKELEDTFAWTKKTVNSMTMEQVRKRRYAIADKTSMPPYINKLANAKGYYVKKCSTSKHPYRVSGYAIFKHKKSKKPIYGYHFDLTIKQVREFLERR